MKRIVYFLFSLMVLSTACEPLEDTYEELDAAPATTKVTLSTANYQSLRGQANVPSYVTSSYYFKSEEEAATILPLFLNPTYGRLDEGDKIEVTYSLLSSTHPNTVSSRETYTVTTEDYTAAGISNSRFNVANGDADAIKFLNYRYPTPADRQLVVLTFNSYNSNVSTTATPVTDTFYYIDGRWVNAYHVTEANYIATDNGRFKNFSAIHDAMLPNYFNSFLKETVFGPRVNEARYVSYLYYNGTTTAQNIMGMVFNGTDWVKAPAVVSAPAVITFIKKQGVWVADIAIKYTMERADYTWISTQTNLGTAAQLSNLGSFGNFYQASSSSANYWSDANIQAALAALLKSKFPNAEVDQKYDVSYVYYAGSNRTGTFRFQKQSSGDFAYVRE